MRAYRRTVIRIVTGALGAALLASCAVDGVGVDGSVGVGYVGGYYEPYGYDYGGWGPGYAVGPYRGGHGGWNRDRGHAPAFRPPSGGRGMPSLPGRPRGR
jgi:hypothetical protein